MTDQHSSSPEPLPAESETCADASLEARQAFLETLLEQVGVGVLVFDPEEGRTIDANNRALAMLNIQRHSLQSLPCLDSGLLFKTGDRAENVICPDLYAAEGLEEGLLMGKGDVVTPVSRRLFHAELEGRELVVQAFIDITEQKKLERQLSMAQRLESVGLLAAGVAHEINTPIQYVSDSVEFIKDAINDLQEVLAAYEVLEEQLPQTSEVQKAVHLVRDFKEDVDLPFLNVELPRACDRALDGVQRVSRIVLAMKNFSHVGGEEMKPVDLNKALENTLVVAKNEWKYAAEVETSFDQELPLVVCLPGDMNQVFLNMVVNAAHAIQSRLEQEGGKGSAKGRIRIATAKDGDYAVVHIQDNGCGIKPEHMTRIFDPFFTTKEVGKGTGQGLAIAHDIVVNKHHGVILVDSSPGKGTLFVIRLPFLQPEQGSAAKGARA
ncbi:sensor histidine kinase [Megalodesulfovibrio gigas]|uniref:histidine kinase n=1 Tax=Megalodesulfovibrio gigas (strain ATCC 19364 / DSM 1382 / NCIMB 9332 / VKM B-1759) TaxID=1121448 RepID=T2GAV0_MEGG1|nr:ATP-binding protein [Megalodesulfovibrio gigas]AGW13251.1 putative PAS/PAC sensor signal transduction histidine kinase [Megalodesulfovibrio gigas DSM 1382 = ATCC 19364]